MKNVIYVFMFILVVYIPDNIFAELSPQFSENIHYVQVPEYQLRQPILSPDGHFLFANGNQFEFDYSVGVSTTNVLNTNQYLWDLREIDFSDTAISLQPDQTLSLNETSNTAGRFSPDGRYLAIKTDTEVQLWRLPDFELEKTATAVSQMNSGTFYGTVAWSLDGQLLGVLINDAILVWDIEQDTQMYYFFEYDYGILQATVNGWFIAMGDGAHISGYDAQELGAFTVCNPYLETCHTATYQNYDLSFATSDGSYILIPIGSVSGDGSVTVLRNREVFSDVDVAVTYVIEDQWQQQSFHNMGLPGMCIQGFSPNSTYVVSECPENISIHDLTTQQPLSIIQEQDIYFLAWLPDNQHFVISQRSPDFDEVVIYLYALGIEEPVDTLYLNQQPGLENAADLYILRYTEYERASISVDGRLLLVNAGAAAFLIPIEYE